LSFFEYALDANTVLVRAIPYNSGSDRCHDRSQ